MLNCTRVFFLLSFGLTDEAWMSVVELFKLTYTLWLYNTLSNLILVDLFFYGSMIESCLFVTC